MLKGIGIDITTIARFKNPKNKKTFLKNFLNDREISQADILKNKSRYWATMFAIKEAVTKAFKIGFHAGSYLHDITINKNFNVDLCGILSKTSKRKTEILVSKTSSEKYALGLALTYE
ncbi:MAG: 4'-phosphopantetheinyl transferase superfamily protein [bacterium]